MKAFGRPVPRRAAPHMNRSIYLTLRNLPVLVLVVLAACGGGGNGSAGNVPPTGTLPTATLTAPEDRSPACPA